MAIKTFQDALSIKDPKKFMEWLVNSPDEVAEVVDNKMLVEGEENRKASTFLSTWISKKCSLSHAKFIAKSIGYNDEPIFFQKRAKEKLIAEMLVLNSSLVIFATNMTVNPDRAKVIIDAYLSLAKDTVFGDMEKADPKFHDQYERQIGKYFALLRSGSFDELSYQFLSALGQGQRVSSRPGQAVLNEIYSSIREVHEVLKNTFQNPY